MIKLSSRVYSFIAYTACKLPFTQFYTRYTSFTWFINLQRLNTLLTPFRRLSVSQDYDKKMYIRYVCVCVWA